MAETKTYWFPAKRYGWGWGMPVTWQGWLVLVLFIALMSGAAVMYPPTKDTVAFLASMVGLVIAFTLVCYATGEPPRWRWGDD